MNWKIIKMIIKIIKIFNNLMNIKKELLKQKM